MTVLIFKTDWAKNNYVKTVKMIVMIKLIVNIYSIYFPNCFLREVLVSLKIKNIKSGHVRYIILLEDANMELIIFGIKERGSQCAGKLIE